MQKFSHTNGDEVMRTMNLQLFAGAEVEGDAAAASTQADAQSTPSPDANNAPSSSSAEQAEKAYSVEDVNRIVEQRLARFKRDEDKRLAAAREEGKSEAEKLAKMSEQERVEHAKKAAEEAARAREDAIARREAELTMRELRAEAVDTLAQKGLPTQLAEILNYKSAEDCNASIAKVEETFRAAVQEGINARLKQSGVSLRNGTTPEPDKMSDAEYYDWKFGKK